MTCLGCFFYGSKKKLYPTHIARAGAEQPWGADTEHVLVRAESAPTVGCCPGALDEVAPQVQKKKKKVVKAALPVPLSLETLLESVTQTDTFPEAPSSFIKRWNILRLSPRLANTCIMC